MDDILGIDIGGSGIKGAPVNLLAGSLTEARTRIDTPRPAAPEVVATVVRKVVESFPHVDGPIGCTFPAVVRHGRILSAANVDSSWIGVEAAQLFSERCSRDIRVINDADAAGLAEARFGSAADKPGVVLMLTLGTGIGSAMLNNGLLTPNTELGHLEVDGVCAELFASSRARKDAGLSVEEWIPDVNRYLAHLEHLFSPDLIILGGGVSKRFAEFEPLLKTDAEIVPAALRNNAGIVGAAMWAVHGDSESV